MPKHTLYLVTYDRGKHPATGHTQPYHWIFFIQTKTTGTEDVGIVHQLRGLPGGFHYEGPEQTDLAAPGGSPIKQQLEIGEVDASKLDWVHGILKGVAIDDVESSGWNCQNWTLAGMEGLRAEGFVYDYITAETARNWLKEE